MTAALVGLLVGVLGFGASLFLPVPQNLLTSFDAGQSLYVLGEYEGAIHEYSKIVRFESNAVDDSKVTVTFEELELPVKAAAWYQLGNSYKKGGRHEEAVEAYRHVLDIPEVPEDFRSTVQFQIGDTRFSQEQFELAAAEYDKFVELFPESDFVGKAYYYGGWSRFKLGRYDESISVLNGMLERLPDDRYAPDALFRIANSYFEKGDYEKSITISDQVLERYPESPVIASAQYLKANSHDKLGRADDAIGAYNGVIDLYDKMFVLLRGSFREGRNVDFDEYKRLFESSFLRIAEIYREDKRDFVKAYDTYVLAQEKVEERSSKAKLQMRIGDNYVAWKRFDDAWKAYDDVIKLYSDTGYPPNAQYLKGEAWYYGGEYEKAREDYLKLLDDYPDTETALLAAALYSAGWSSEKLGETDEALRLYNRAISSYPRSKQAPMCLLRVGRLLYERGEYDGAISAYQRILDGYPETESIGDAYYSLGLVLRDIGEKEKAFDAFRKVTKESGRTYVASLMEAAKLSVEVGRAGETQGILTELLEGVAGDPELEAVAHYQIAWLNAGTEKYREAAEEYTIVIENFPESDVIYDSYFGRASAYQRLQRFRDALADYEVVLEGEASDELKLRARFSMALAYSALGQDEKAAPLLKEVAASGDEELARASRIQQVTMAERRSPEEAIRTYERILSETLEIKERAMILTRLANAYLKLERYSQAADAAKQLIDIATDPESVASAYYVMGNSYYEQENYKEAVKSYQKVTEDYPQTVVALNCLLRLGLSYFHMGVEGIDGSIDAFTKFYQKYPDNEYAPSAYYYTAWGYYRKGDWATSADVFEELVRRFPRDRFAPESLYRAGESKFNERNYEEAFGLFQKVLDKYPRSNYVDDAMYSKAWCLVRLGRAEEAVPIFREIVSKFKDTMYGENSQFTLGDYYYGLEMYEEAEADYKKFIELFPNSRMVPRAEILLAHLAEISAYELYSQGERLFDQEKYDEAIKVFNSVLEEFPGSESAVSALTNIAAAYQSKEDFGEAAKFYNRIVTEYGENPKYAAQVDFARAQLKALEEAKAI